MNSETQAQLVGDAAMQGRQMPAGGQKGNPSWLLTVLGFVIWVATAAFGLFAIFLGRQTVVRLVGALSRDTYTATLAGHATVIILAVGWLFYVVVGGESKLRLIPSRASWTWFAAGAGVELLILILYVLI